MAGATAYVKHANTVVEFLGKAFHLPDESLDKLGVVDAPPYIIHALRELRSEGRIGNAPSLPKAVHDLGQVITKMIDQWTVRREVLRAVSRQECGMIFW